MSAISGLGVVPDINQHNPAEDLLAHGHLNAIVYFTLVTDQVSIEETKELAANVSSKQL